MYYIILSITAMEQLLAAVAVVKAADAAAQAAAPAAAAAPAVAPSVVTMAVFSPPSQEAILEAKAAMDEAGEAHRNALRRIAAAAFMNGRAGDARDYVGAATEYVKTQKLLLRRAQYHATLAARREIIQAIADRLRAKNQVAIAPNGIYYAPRKGSSAGSR